MKKTKQNELFIVTLLVVLDDWNKGQQLTVTKADFQKKNGELNDIVYTCHATGDSPKNSRRIRYPYVKIHNIEPNFESFLLQATDEIWYSSDYTQIIEKYGPITV